MPAGTEIVAAMDADEAGHVLAAIVRGAFDMTGRPDLHFRIHQPSGAKDWNDLLLGRTAAPKLVTVGGPSLA
jgi:hypothetical protein